MYIFDTINSKTSVSSIFSTCLDDVLSSTSRPRRTCLKKQKKRRKKISWKNSEGCGKSSADRRWNSLPNCAVQLHRYGTYMLSKFFIWFLMHGNPHDLLWQCAYSGQFRRTETRSKNKIEEKINTITTHTLTVHTNAVLADLVFLDVEYAPSVYRNMSLRRERKQKK